MILDQTTIIYSALGVILLLLIIAVFWIIHLEKKLKKILIGKSASSIEESLENISKDLTNLNKFKTELETYLVDVEKRLRRSVQGVHTLRFNPFKGTGSGGNQSFATAILNEEGDGVILSSLYSREHVSIFSKPVKKYIAEFELSEEEKEALLKAREILSVSK